MAELLGTLPLSRDDCFDTALAAGEALSNAYDHACGGEGEKPPIPVLAPDAPPLWSKTFTIRAGVENLGAYRHRVAELLGTLPLSRDDCFDTALAAGEALSNAYDHACGGEGSTMSVIAYADRVVIEVRDCGCGFEIGDDEEPVESRERGRGIRLMRMLVNSVEVRRRTDVPGTEVRLIKLIS